MTADALFRTVDGASPGVDASAWVAPGVVVSGDVRLHAGASIWYNTVLRADEEHIEIGANTNIQDLCVSHTDTGFPTVIGAGVSVGHRAVLHGCRVGDDALVGMGAVLLNGVVIGASSMVAAGAVVLEGTEVPPGSLVAGVPGKVRRELTDDERQGLIQNTRTYLGLRDLHASED